MLKNQGLSTYRIGRLIISFVLALIVWSAYGYSQNVLEATKEAILEGSISIEPQRPLDDKTKVQPGTPVKLKLTIENKGQTTNAPGQAYIRFCYSKPLENQPGSVVFQTEKEPLPSIEPGKKVEIVFTSSHQWPTLLDFVRNDWSMREYQAILVVGDEEKTIETLALTVSAYYYPGVKKEFPVHVAPVGN